MILVAVGLEALVLLVLGGAEVLSVVTGSAAQSSDVATGSGLFFLFMGLVVVGVGYGVWRRLPAVYGGTVFLQLLALALVITMAGAGFWLGVVALVLVAGSALIALLSLPGRLLFGRGEP